MTQTTTAIQPTTPQLIKATALALTAAGAILVVAVLPAEYGKDLTGLGQVLGLTDLSTPHAPVEQSEQAAVPMPAPAAAVTRSAVPFNSDEMSLVLQPGEGAEIKALMRGGESFVFSWTTDGGPVNFDMHGERPNAGDEFSSYWKDRGRSSGHGSFTAPFDGSHGWYWRNRGEQPVTVRVKLSGFFEKLYRPE